MNNTVLVLSKQQMRSTRCVECCHMTSVSGLLLLNDSNHLSTNTWPKLSVFVFLCVCVHALTTCWLGIHLLSANHFQFSTTKAFSYRYLQILRGRGEEQKALLFYEITHTLYKSNSCTLHECNGDSVELTRLLVALNPGSPFRILSHSFGEEFWPW